MRVVLCLLFLCCTSPLRAAEVLVFAAASLAGPLDEVIEAYAEQTGVDVTVSYAASSAIALQIERGAPADVVFLANEPWMDVLQDGGHLRDGTRHALLGNALVLIGGRIEPQPVEISDLPSVIGADRIAMALTESVPAGIYARAALEAQGQWEALSPHVVEMVNVRSALQAVTLGVVRFGIVYETDALSEPRVQVYDAVPVHLHPPIRYPVAATANATPEADAFVSFLADLPARIAFTAAGFEMLPE